MSVWLVVAAIALSGLSGVPGLWCGARSAIGARFAVAMLAAAAVAGGIAACSVLAGGDALTLAHPWPVPGGKLALRFDALSAVFLLPILGVTLAGATYGLSYWPQHDHPQNGRKLRLFYGLLAAGMTLVVSAHNGVLFLVGWEVMALSAFFAVTTEDSDPHVRRVGYVYLIATRLGTLCLFALFALLGAVNGGFEHALDIDGPHALPAGVTAAVFALALAGFGLKAGIMPLHVWLPGAHANAPSHVSALLSGVVLKMGIYGLVRVLGLWPSPPVWWGGAVLALGVISGVMGVAFAIGQHDIKRLLAYHSVENIGIICIGLGTALLGRAAGRPEVVVLGLAGALLHVWNHALFKSLLFFAAGAVAHATHTREIDLLGGLLRRMPATATLFLVGAVAICGLPPLNGFVSELLVYLGLFATAEGIPAATWLLPALAVGGLALIGGLALACFVKAFGAMFLGVARGEHGASAVDPERSMLVPMAVLALVCVAIGIAPVTIAPALDAAVAAWGNYDPALVSPIVAHAPLAPVSLVAAALAVLVGALGWSLSPRLRATMRGASVVTWDCGYAKPSPRMQYSASSFGQWLVTLFGFALRPDVSRPRLRVTFPPASAFRTHVPDLVLDRCVLPAFHATGRLFERMRWVQRGNVNVYLVYVLVTLLLIMWWRS